MASCVKYTHRPSTLLPFLSWDKNKEMNKTNMGITNETHSVAKKKPVTKTHKCERDGCSKSFRNAYDLKMHVKRHEAGAFQPSQTKLTREKLYVCDKTGCDEAFTRQWSLTRHQQKRHKGGDNIKENNDKKQYECDEPDCRAAFTLPERLQVHKRTCIERQFKCDYGECDKSYRIDAHLKRHKITSHYSEEMDSTKEEVICGMEGCGKTYCNKYVLKQHIAAIHTEQEDIVSPNGVKRKCDIEKTHKCNEPGCGASFYRPYRLENHKLTVHRGKKPIRCDYEGCDKSYTNEAHLARHKNTSHNLVEIDSTKEVICGMEGCGRIYSNKYSLKKHISTTHAEFPFSCQECDEKFKRKSQLHAHNVDVHDKEAPYSCSQCPKAFIHYHLYNKHLKNHKTYQCDCEMKFDKWSKLLRHRKSECSLKQKEHKCIICGKTFPFKRGLTQHSLHVHIPDSQIDLLHCPYLNCKHSYKYKENLKYHIRTYHEKLVKRIKCPEKNCEVVLKSNRNLKQHLRIVHKGLPAKIRKPRKPRKDKGKIKKSMASIISGVEVSAEENFRNILDKNHFKGKSLKVVLDRLDEAERRTCTDEIDGTDKRITEVDSLMDCQSTTPDAVKLLPVTNNKANTEEIIENCHEAPSFAVISIDIDSGCSGNLNILEGKSKESECSPVLYNENLVYNSENMMNEDNSTEEWGKKEIGSNNILVVGCKGVDADSSKNPIILEISEVQLSELQNGKINNSDNTKDHLVDNNTSRDATEISYDNTVNTDTVFLNSSQNSCDSEVVIFNFPEFENVNHCDNMETITNKASVEEQPANVEDDGYIVDGGKLKKRLDVMIKDIFAVVKHLEKDCN